MTKFWVIIFALSVINFGVTFVIAGVTKMTGHELLIETGSWMAFAGVAILVYLVSRNGSGNGGHRVDR